MNKKNKSELKKAAWKFTRLSITDRYSYNFKWLGMPFIQYPQDMVAMQEIIWRVKPDLIIETGVAHGGGLVFYASMLAMLDKNFTKNENQKKQPKRKVLGIDIHIRPENRCAIEKHFLNDKIELIEGSSIDKTIISKVREKSGRYKNIMVCLDSNHTYQHVLKELDAYADLVSKDSYCVVFDTIIEELPKSTYLNRPWSSGNSPETAVKAFLKKKKNFVLDKNIYKKLLISVAAKGYLKRIK
jgi:cephalosporin hydroxylase